MDKTPQTLPRDSWTYSPSINAEIRRAADTGIYDPAFPKWRVV